jgi:hypothetical protein
MRRVRSFRVEALEPRKLLTKAHAVAVHPAPAAPLVLNGTLLVDTNPKATTTKVNPDSGSTTSVRVTGTLGALGAVQGVWNETVDVNGNSEGADVLRLRNAAGSVIVAFNDTGTARAMPAGHGAESAMYAQNLFNATGAYAGTAEKGSIQLVTNRAHSEVTSLVLHTKAT